MKIVVLDGYTENPGDLSWEGLEAVSYTHLDVYKRQVQRGKPLWKPRTTKQAEYLALSRCLIFSLYLLSAAPFRGLCVVPCKLT